LRFGREVCGKIDPKFRKSTPEILSYEAKTQTSPSGSILKKMEGESTFSS